MSSNNEKNLQQVIRFDEVKVTVEVYTKGNHSIIQIIKQAGARTIQELPDDIIQDVKYYQNVIYLLGKHLYAFEIDGTEQWQNRGLQLDGSTWIEQINQNGIVCVEYQKLKNTTETITVITKIVVVSLSGKVRLSHCCDNTMLLLPYDVYIGENLICAPESEPDDIKLDEIVGEFDIDEVKELYKAENSKDFDKLSKKEQLDFFYEHFFPSGHEVLVRIYAYDLQKENTYYFGDCFTNHETALSGIEIKVDKGNFTFKIDIYDYEHSLAGLSKVTKIKAKREGRWINYTTTQKDLEDKECVLVNIRYSQNNKERLDLYNQLNERLKCDQDIIKALLRKNGYILKDLPEEYRTNEEFVIFALASSGIELLEQLALTEYLSSSRFVVKAVKSYPKIFHHLAADMKRESAVIAALLSSVHGIKEAGDLLQEKEFAIEAIRSCGAKVLKYIGESLYQDFDIIKEAIEKGPIYELKNDLIGADLQTDQQLFELALERVNDVHISTCFQLFKPFQDDKQSVLNALERFRDNDRRRYFFHDTVSDRLKLDLEIITKVFIDKFPGEYTNPEDFYLDLYQKDRFQFKKSLPKSLKKNRQFLLRMFECIKSKSLWLSEEDHPLQIMDPSFRKDKEIFLEAIKLRADQICLIAEEYLDDRDYLLILIRTNPEILGYLKLSSSFYTREIALEFVELYGFVIKVFDDVYRNDPEIALAAVKQHGMALRFLPEQFKNDRSYVLAAIRSGKNFFMGSVLYEFIPEQFKSDKEVVKEVVYYDGESFWRINEEFKQDRDILRAATIGWGANLKYCPDEMKDDKDLVMQGLQTRKSSIILDYCSERLRDDKEVILEAIKYVGRAYRNASERLKNDKEVAIAALQKDVSVMEFLPERLKEDRDIKLLIDKNNQLDSNGNGQK